MPDSVPNYLTIDPTTGAVGATFTGNIVAQGLDLTASPVVSPVPTSKIRWLRGGVGGAVIATVSTYDDFSGTQEATYAVSVTPQTFNEGGNVDLAAQGFGNNNWPASLSLHGGVDLAAGTDTIITAQGGGDVMTLITGDNKSSYVQIGSATERLRMSHVAAVQVNTPAMAINAEGTCTVSLPVAVKPAGVAQKNFLPTIVFGGGLFNNVALVGVNMNALGNDVTNVTIRNNTGVAQAANTIRFQYVVFY